MNKFLLTLSLLAMASPAWAVSIANWSTNPIVSGDKTYTLNSASGLNDAAVDVIVTDTGFAHSLNLSGLGGTTANFALNFTVTVNSGPNVIKNSRISQNDILNNTTAGTSNVTTGGGTYTDNLLLTQTGNVNSHGVTSITFDTTSSGVDGSNLLSNITYDLTQETPAVPEPSTFALAGLAVAGLVIARRRAR